MNTNTNSEGLRVYKITCEDGRVMEIPYKYFSWREKWMDNLFKVACQRIMGHTPTEMPPLEEGQVLTHDMVNMQFVVNCINKDSLEEFRKACPGAGDLEYKDASEVAEGKLSFDDVLSYAENNAAETKNDSE